MPKGQAKGSRGRRRKEQVEQERVEVEEREEEVEGLGDGDEDEEDSAPKFEIFDKIVAFFEERPYFYDISHEAYSNRKRKDAEVAEFAKTIGWNGE